MAFRMLRYVVRQLEHWRHQHPSSEALPVVIPVVMYHGPEGGWTAPRRVEELFQLPQEHLGRWQNLVPRFEYLLDDLTVEREEALRARPGPPLVPLALLLLRSGRSEQLAMLLEGWRPLWAQVLTSPQGLEQLRAAIHYLLNVGAEEALQALRRMLNSIADEQQRETLMRTMADALRDEGREEGWREGLARGKTEGLAEGQARGRADAVLRLLAARGIAVDEEARQRILSCRDLATLDQWFDRALKATSLSDLDSGH